MKILGVSIALALVCVTSAYAQAVIGTGTISGAVRDYTGSGIPDTTVILTNDKTGFRREMDTSDDGGFTASAMPPGAGYTMKVTRKGFQDVDYNNIDILVGHTLNFQVTLAQELTAQRAGEPQKASAEMRDEQYGFADTFPHSETDGLPTPQRDVLTLAPLSLAVVENDATGQLGFHSESNTVAILTDGILTTNTYFYNRPPITPPATQESVEEMQVVSGGAPAEFSHTMAGTINMVRQTGGPAIHGEGYEYFNTHSLNATDKIAPGFDPAGWQHQFGVNLGGPLPLVSKVFWFVNLEDLDAHSQELNRTSNPLIANSLGTAVLPSNCTATAAQCATAISFLNAQLGRVIDSSLTSFSGLAKVDWRPNEFNNFTLEADAGQRHAPNGTDIETAASNAGLLGGNGTYSDGTRFFKAGYTAVWSGNAVNEVRAGWYKDRFSDYEDSQLLPSTGALGINIADTPFGGNPQLPWALSEERYQIVDNFTFTSGTHSIKLGADFSTNEDWNRQIIGSAGYYNFPTLTAFADDLSGNTKGTKDYSTFTQTFGLPIVDLHTKDLGVYIQDTWSPTRRLTLVMGVNWEKPFIPQPTDTNPTYFQTGSISAPDIDFSPRVGIGYRINDRTVFRVGMGTYYQPFSGQLLQALYTGNAIYQLPITAVPTQTKAPIFPKIIGAPGSIPPGSADVTYGVGKFRLPFSAQGALSVERQLSSSMTVSLNYMYNRGIGLLTAVNQNLNYPTLPAKTYTIDNAAGAAVSTYPTLMFNTLTNGSFGRVYQIQNEGYSIYDGLALRFVKRMSHGVTAQASYTWSRAVDDVSGPAVLAGFIPASSFPNASRNDAGNSSFNQPNRVVMNWTWQPTFGSRGNSLMGRYLLNGWQLSGIATLASGLGETPLVLVNGQQFSGVTMLDTSSLNGSGGWARVPFQAVNSLSTGPEYDVDVRLSRALPITERIKGVLMFEAFNAFNMQYNTSVNTLAYVATSGVLRPVAGVGVGDGADGFPWGDNARHLQVALKITF